jgi:leucyl aminopeptidase (aminopeptidase T)
MEEELIKVSKQIYENAFSATKEDKILILFDSKKIELAKALDQAATELELQAMTLEIPVGKVNGEEPSNEVAQTMLKYDIILGITTKSLTHTHASKNAVKNGARIATMPNITKEMFLRCIDVDYAEMQRKGLALKEVLDAGKSVKIISEDGSELTFSIEGRISKPDDGILKEKGILNNLPAGETFLAPLEGTATGKYVIDASHAGIGVVQSPLHFTVEKGIVNNIEGEQAEKLKEILDSVNDPKAYVIAELGIGFNPKAEVSGKTLEDEKVLGTCHIAVGNNVGFGGTNDVPIHMDGIMRMPTLWVDETLVIDKGKLLF